MKFHCKKCHNDRGPRNGKTQQKQNRLLFNDVVNTDHGGHVVY